MSLKRQMPWYLFILYHVTKIKMIPNSELHKLKSGPTNLMSITKYVDFYSKFNIKNPNIFASY